MNSTHYCLLIPNENENKYGVFTSSYLQKLIKQTQKFLSNDPRCNCFASLSRDANNFANGCHIKESYSVLHSTQTDTQRAAQRAVCTQLYMKPHQSVDIVRRCVSKQQHSQQL
jgi:hypothetical protein